MARLKEENLVDMPKYSLPILETRSMCIVEAKFRAYCSQNLGDKRHKILRALCHRASTHKMERVQMELISKSDGGNVSKPRNGVEHPKEGNARVFPPRSGNSERLSRYYY